MNHTSKKALHVTFAAVCAASLLLLTACGSGQTSSQNASNVSDSSSSSTQPAYNEEQLNPLTGLYNLPEGAYGKRPISVMVNNIKQALPQYGIGSADICYESLTEGGITRIMAVFADYASLPRIGSVRSARDCFLELAAPLDTIFVHFGGSSSAYDTIAARGIDTIDGIAYSETGFMSDSAIAASKGREHSFFTDKDLIQNPIEHKKQRTQSESPLKPIFHFVDPSEPEYVPQDGEALQATISFSGYATSVFDYNAGDQKYYKNEYGSPQMDAGSGKQIAVDNVFVVLTSITLSSDGVHTNVAFDSGDGYYISQGKYQKVHWEKDGFDAPLVFTNTDGSELKVNPGQSWVCIAPIGDNIVQFSGGEAA